MNAMKEIVEAIESKYGLEASNDHSHLIVNEAPDGLQKLHTDDLDGVKVEVAVGGGELGYVRVGGQDGEVLQGPTGTVNRLLREEFTA
jgi:hypothetical protein